MVTNTVCGGSYIREQNLSTGVVLVTVLQFVFCLKEVMLKFFKLQKKEDKKEIKVL